MPEAAIGGINQAKANAEPGQIPIGVCFSRGFSLQETRFDAKLPVPEFGTNLDLGLFLWGSAVPST